MTQFHNCLSGEERGKLKISVGIPLPMADIIVKALAIYSNNIANEDIKGAVIEAYQFIDSLIFTEEMKEADKKAGLKWGSENTNILKN